METGTVYLRSIFAKDDLKNILQLYERGKKWNNTQRNLTEGDVVLTADATAQNKNGRCW